MKIYNKSLILFFVIFLVSSQVSSNTHQIEQQIKEALDIDNYAVAETLLKDLLKLNPENSTAYLLSAELYYKTGNFEESISNINRALYYAPQNVQNYILAGNIYRQSGKYQEAADAYNKALEIDPGIAETYYEFSLLRFQELKIMDAQRLLNLSESFNPKAWQNNILKARLAQHQSKSNLAQQIFLETIAQFPQEVGILHALADYYIDEKNYAKAVAVLKEANTRFGKSVKRDIQIADLLFIKQKFSEALTYYQNIKNVFSNVAYPIAASVNWNLYKLYLIQNDSNNAEISLKTAFELSPGNQMYHSIYAFFLAKKYPPSHENRISLTKYFEQTAKKNKKKGLSSYYLTLLKTIILLDPFNDQAYHELLEFAKIKKNEFQVTDILKQIAKYSTNKKAITTLEIRDRWAKTGRLNQKEHKLYQYKILFFIDENQEYYAQHFSDILEFLNPMFPKFELQTKINKNFALESRSFFRTNTNNGLIIHLSNDKDNHIKALFFDKKGLLVKNREFNYHSSSFTENALQLLKAVSQYLVPIAYIEKRLPDSSFETDLGSSYGITNNQLLSVFDENFQLITELTVLETQLYSSKARLNSTPANLDSAEILYTTPKYLDKEFYIDPVRLFIGEYNDTFPLNPTPKYN
ncbi:Tfp pilus assembly protein PilF [Brevinema andersonii]|uniref:Tfp pilus assembly protein PilF n=1 Tax=Brevinema andersonii TaxID=34097 RepID=A0A1I1CYV0_BREAD|nr:tetratricopeptide repeat protein [Brevinema andersonii]SFB67694.1 Tfp pilus assembly protein PilF [Brevinema andersonii]